MAEHEYFAGDFSFADIQMSFPLEALQSRLQGKYPHIQAFYTVFSKDLHFKKRDKRELVLTKGIVLIFKRKGTNICSFFIFTLLAFDHDRINATML